MLSSVHPIDGSRSGVGVMIIIIIMSVINDGGK